jgi:hypothetical protein
MLHVFTPVSCRLWGVVAGYSLAACLSAPAAHAVVVTVGGTSYDVLVTNRAYTDDPSFFSSASMPWFTANPADNNLAYEFAAAVFDQLGSFYYPGFTEPGGPLFAFAINTPNILAVFQETNDPNIQNETNVVTSQAYNYAYATSAPVPTSVPSPLPLIGAVAALRAARRLRHRLTHHA